MATINDYIKEISEAQTKEWEALGYNMTKVPLQLKKVNGFIK